MTLTFYKYQGAGNDFIIIDNRKNILDPADRKRIKQICDRRFGIGADGLMMLYDHKEADFEMKYFNSDGYEGTMCGNGGRCIVMFAKKKKLIKHKTMFKTSDGVHTAEITDTTVRLRMNDVITIRKLGDSYFIDTGSPHYVTFTNDVDNIDVFNKGSKLRNNKQFKPHGTNVNFVQIQENGLSVRTYERGVEDETLSCGTGAVAAAIVSVYSGQIDSNNVQVKTRGGILNVSFRRNDKGGFSDIILEGPAVFVFEGEITDHTGR